MEPAERVGHGLVSRPAWAPWEAEGREEIKVKESTMKYSRVGENKKR